MIKVRAIKTIGHLQRDQVYYIGGLVQGTSQAVVMDEGKIEIIPGRYDSVSVFGLSRNEILKMIKEGK